MVDVEEGRDRGSVGRPVTQECPAQATVQRTDLRVQGGTTCPLICRQPPAELHVTGINRPGVFISFSPTNAEEFIQHHVDLDIFIWSRQPTKKVG